MKRNLKITVRETRIEFQARPGFDRSARLSRLRIGSGAGRPETGETHLIGHGVTFLVMVGRRVMRLRHVQREIEVLVSLEADSRG